MLQYAAAILVFVFSLSHTLSLFISLSLSLQAIYIYQVLWKSRKRSKISNHLRKNTHIAFSGVLLFFARSTQRMGSHSLSLSSFPLSSHLLSVLAEVKGGSPPPMSRHGLVRHGWGTRRESPGPNLPESPHTGSPLPLTPQRVPAGGGLGPPERRQARPLRDDEAPGRA